MPVIVLATSRLREKKFPFSHKLSLYNGKKVTIHTEEFSLKLNQDNLIHKEFYYNLLRKILVLI